MEMRVRRSLYAALLTLGLISTFGLVSSAAGGPTGISADDPAPQVPAAPLDDPEPLVTESFTEWTIGGGMLYWANRCFPGPDRVALGAQSNHYYLRRQPLAGGAIRTLQTRDDGNCVTYVGMAADDTAVYYFNDADDRVEFVPVDDPDGPPQILSSNVTSVNGDIQLGDDYVYWATYQATISRVPRTGGVATTFVTTSGNVDDFVFDGSHLYWLDDDGMWWVDKDCSPVPCAKERIYTGGGRALIRSGAGFFGLPQPVYWIDDAVPFRIRSILYIAPNQFTLDTLYTASADWFPGELATARLSALSFGDSHVFWTETNPPDEGRLRRVPIGGGTGVDIAVGSSGMDRRVFTDNRYVYFADIVFGVGATLYRLPLNASAIQRDLAFDAWEVTQAVQNLDNEVPLVADKPTFVRVYGRQLSGPAASATDAWLAGTRGGNPLPGSPLQPIEGSVSLAPGAGYDRADLEDGWLFRLPASWTDAGAVELEAVVDPRQAYNDPNRGNNDATRTFTFDREPRACLFLWPVLTHQPEPSYQDPNFWETIDRFERLWPIPGSQIIWNDSPIREAEFCTWHGIPYPCFGPYELNQGSSLTNFPSDRDRVIGKLIRRQIMESVPAGFFLCDDDAPIHSVGIVHPDSNTASPDDPSQTVGGYANLVFSASWTKFPPHDDLPPSNDPWSWPRQGSTFAQELAHNFGRKHIPCGTSDNVDNGYTYSDPCEIDDRDQADPNTHFGFDSGTRSVVPPDDAADFMTYASDRWVSDYSYKAIKGEFGRKLVESLAASTPAAELGRAEQAVIVSGAVDPEANHGALDYAYVLSTTTATRRTLELWGSIAVSPWDASQQGYHLRLTDGDGTVLEDRALTLLETDEHDEAAHAQPFFASFPAPAGIVTRVELLSDTQILDVLQPGAGLPDVEILTPGADDVLDGDLTVRWRAIDPDPADRLLYSLFYSPDQGENWFTLATDYAGLPGEAEVAFTVADPQALPGSDGLNGLVRVVASDGYHTGAAIAGPFTVPERGPQPFILDPTPERWVAAGTAAVLRGGALDAEDGMVADDGLSWTADGQAAGSGPDGDLTGLTPGSYAVVLRATDSDGDQGTAESRLNVSPLTIPFTGSTLSLDGFCDETAYAGASRLSLAPYADGSRATLQLLRRTDALFACFSGMQRGSGDQISTAGLRVDPDRSQDGLAQEDDYGFFVGEDGTPYTLAGDAAGSYDPADLDGFRARVTALGTTWGAELRVDAGLLGGWDHSVGLDLGHFGLSGVGDDYRWPYDALSHKPDTWAHTLLGDWPRIEALSPVSATLGGPTLTLTVSGTNFADGTTAMWDGAPLATEVASSGRLTVEVGADRLGTAGRFELTVVAPGLEDAPSAPAFFAVQNPRPVLTALTPDTAKAGEDGFTLTLGGSGFVDGAVALWNGQERPTTFLEETQLEATITAQDLASGRTVGVLVRNPGPGGGATDTMTFLVEMEGSGILFLPVVLR
jgi:hypothetical protein